MGSRDASTVKSRQSPLRSPGDPRHGIVFESSSHKGDLVVRQLNLFRRQQSDQLRVKLFAAKPLDLVLLHRIHGFRAMTFQDIAKVEERALEQLKHLPTPTFCSP